MNYFVFNKELDYRRGYGEGVVWDADRLVLEEGRREGVFFSRVFDSQEAQTRWQRFVMDAEGRGTASILFTFYGIAAAVRIHFFRAHGPHTGAHL